MNKRLVKRHKRQVARAKEKVKLSEPDLRTPEQVRAAREASRPAGGVHNVQHHHAPPRARAYAGAPPNSTAKADG